MSTEKMFAVLSAWAETPLFEDVRGHITGYWFGRAFDLHRCHSVDGVTSWWIVQLASDDEEDVVAESIVDDAQEVIDWLTCTINAESEAIDWASILIEWDTMNRDLEVSNV